jgi:hypothetical protein
MVNSEETIGTIECLTVKARCCIKQFRYNRVRLYILSTVMHKKNLSL